MGKHFATYQHICTSFIVFSMQLEKINVILFSYIVYFRHILSYPFFQTYVRISLSDMNEFSLRDLPTFYLPPYVSIMFRNSVPSNLMRSFFVLNIHNYFDNFLTLECNLDHIAEDLCDTINV